MMKRNNRIAYIQNAIDFRKDPKMIEEGDRKNTVALKRIGLDPELLDLRQYFSRQKRLGKKLDRFGGVWVRVGNTLVLRQAMKLSGFNVILKKHYFVYAGYSAGVCVLAPSLHGLQMDDDPSQMPYGRRSRLSA